MTASTLFQAFTVIAFSGWIALAIGIITKRDWLRDKLAGLWIPVLLSAAYAALILLFFAKSEGGFDSLENVQKLFTNSFAALAGWVHYLAFDLFIGARIARESAKLKLPRWPLFALLPLTFLFGPMGFLAFEIIKSTRKDEQS